MQAEGNADHGASSSLTQAAAIAQQTSMFSAQISVSCCFQEHGVETA